jgi:CRP-like cAMP-binding protein
MLVHPSSAQRNLFLSMLPVRDQERLESQLTRFELRSGDYLCRRGSLVDEVVFPHTGLVTLGLTMEDSTIQGIAVAGREAVIGGFAAMADAPALSDAQVHIGGLASRIPAEAFREATEGAAVMRRMATCCEGAIAAQAQQSAICNAVHSVEARISRWLLEIRDRCDTDRLLLTQSDLAAMLGVRRTTVTLVAGRLQNLGAIRCRRGYVYVTNREILERCSCECFRQVKSYVERLFQHCGSAFAQHQETNSRPAKPAMP